MTTRGERTTSRLLSVLLGLMLLLAAPAVAAVAIPTLGFTNGTAGIPTTGPTNDYDAVAQHLSAAPSGGDRAALARNRPVLGPAGFTADLSAARADFVAAKTAAKTPRIIRAGDLKLPGVPKGAAGTVTDNGKCLQYAIPRGTPDLNERVTGIRVMEPTTTGKHPYPMDA